MPKEMGKEGAADANNVCASEISLQSRYEDPYLRACWSHESSTGGGAGVDTVLVLISPMIARASFRAWYIRSISSRLCACSADSSIRVFWSSEEYKWARSSALINSLTYFIRQNKQTNKANYSTEQVQWEIHRTRREPYLNFICFSCYLVYINAIGIAAFVRSYRGLKMLHSGWADGTAAWRWALTQGKAGAHSWAEQLPARRWF